MSCNDCNQTGGVSQCSLYFARCNGHFLGISRTVDDLRSVALPAGRSTGCVIKPAAWCLINESDEWHASDDDDGERRRPGTRNRSQPREERELRPRCITHLRARERTRRIADARRERMHRDHRSRVYT